MTEYSSVTGLPLKPCKKGYVRNPATNRCKKIRYSPVTGLPLKPCSRDHDRNKATNRCKRVVKFSPITGLPLKPCKKDYVRNKATNRCKKIASPVKNTVKKPNKPIPDKTAKKAANARKKVVKQTTWNEIISAWKAGKRLPEVKGSVFWETSVANLGGDSSYKVKTASASAHLPMSLKATPSIFRKHLKNKKTPVSFMSLGNPPTLLVVPPDTGKNFSHIGTFYKNSTTNEKRALWKKVAVELEKKLAAGETVYVSTHGLGVSWLHVRLSSTPKYYQTSW